MRIHSCTVIKPVCIAAKKLVCVVILFITCMNGFAPAHAAPKISVPASLHDFSVFRLGSGDPVVLVVGGIQGDEPGGFSAATLLATCYAVHKGSIWVVPNLNFPSIIKRSRGVYGDMNRKFLSLDKKDPQYSAISRIQKLILAPEVKLVLNLHDGSGYYRPNHIDVMHNPQRWGQSVIIDQEQVDKKKKVVLNNLDTIATAVIKNVNAKRLLKSEHTLNLHNTHTATSDKEMEKSLSWFAVRHGKAAFGLEASKEFSVELRAYYHLCMIEAFLAEAGVATKRDFDLSMQGIRTALQSNLSISFARNRISLPLENVRPDINYLPLPKQEFMAIPSKPIMAVLQNKDELHIHYGNRLMTRIKPDWRRLDTSIDSMHVTIDGKKQIVAFGQTVPVNESFLVHGHKGVRVNAIGATLRQGDESDLTIKQTHFSPRFSIDKQGTIFRVEVYKNQDFCGMFMVRFPQKTRNMRKQQRGPST